MKIAYYPDTDSMYIDLSEKPSVDSQEVSPGVVIDYDEKGNIVGIDIDNAKNKLELNELVLSKLPLQNQIISA
jgi:uncharacterized protein YuzE